MPLTKFQAKIAKLLATNRNPNSFLAGGAAFCFSPNFNRYSSDLDYFNDSIELVAHSYEKDQKVLELSSIKLEVVMAQPGFIRAVATEGKDSTKIEWVHDTNWRFMPAIFNEDAGFILNPIDLSVNKLLALVGRNEPRDFIDTLYCHKNLLSLGALCWAAVAKDPGFTPFSLVDLVKRRGSFRKEDLEKLNLVKEINLVDLKNDWLSAISQAEDFVNSRDISEVGCLYYNKETNSFFSPNPNDQYQIHHGSDGGILPKFV